MSKASQLGAGASFGQARPVSARRAAIGAATGAPTLGVPDPTELPTALISHNPDNPRDHLRDLDGITQTIKELGVINAITVANIDAYLRERPDRAGHLDDGAKYVVVDGHRRLEGARRADRKTIKVLVDDARVATDEALLEAAFVSNVHRDGMTDLEQAHALESLVKFYGSQTKAAQRLGISQATISSKLSLLKLTPELQAELASGERQVEHVRNLGKLTSEEQKEAADKRAATARQRAETKRAQPLSTTTEPGSQRADDYHGVIIADGNPTGATPLTAAEPGGDLKVATVPAQLGEHGSTPEHDLETEQADCVHKKMPWHDVHAVAALISDRMTYANRVQLTALLEEQNRQDTTQA